MLSDDKLHEALMRIRPGLTRKNISTLLDTAVRDRIVNKLAGLKWLLLEHREEMSWPDSDDGKLVSQWVEEDADTRILMAMNDLKGPTP